MSLAPESIVESQVFPDASAREKPDAPHANGRIKKMNPTRQPTVGTLVERPGIEPRSWEQWLFFAGKEPELLAPNSLPSGFNERLLVLPSSSLFSWPLWIADEGEGPELVRMELAGRHLIKRGMEESLVVLPILRREKRRLLLAVAADMPFPVELMPADWKSASRFELPARLLGGSLLNDLVLWNEWGALHMAFYREQKPVWFCGVRPDELSGVIHRMALRLLAEGVLEHLPKTILLEGLPEELAEKYTSELTRAFPHAKIASSTISREQTSSPPVLPGDSFDLPPDEARSNRHRVSQQQRFFSIATAGALLYLLLLLWGAGDLFIRQTALKRLRKEIATMEPTALEIQKESTRWHTLRQVIDPTTYALDLLAAVAAPTYGGKVRLTLFSLEQGRLHLSGEATDVTQAYNFIEQLKKNPLLQEYDWNAGQPQLAGKNSVKFDMEGTRPDAPHETTGPQ